MILFGKGANVQALEKDLADYKAAYEREAEANTKLMTEREQLQKEIESLRAQQNESLLAAELLQMQKLLAESQREIVTLRSGAASARIDIASVAVPMLPEERLAAVEDAMPAVGMGTARKNLDVAPYVQPSSKEEAAVTITPSVQPSIGSTVQYSTDSYAEATLTAVPSEQEREQLEQSIRAMEDLCRDYDAVRVS